MNWLIGTSGWSYKNWDKEFYPKGVKGVDKIRHYSQHFNAVEINASFYNHIESSTYEKWAALVPENFEFVVKLHRYVTQMKKLKADDKLRESLDKFFESIQGLGKNCGPILIQLPPSLKKDLDKLGNFLELLPNEYRYAMEFRHASWFDQETEDLLHKHRTALIISHSPKWPMHITSTTDFIYLRFHGKEVLFVSAYEENDMKSWGKELNKLAGNTERGYIFYNNTDQGHAITNANQIKKYLE